MKTLQSLAVAALVASCLAAPLAGFAADKKEKAKPYPLKTCVVSGEKLGEMGDPVVYDYKGQEIKFCCKDCIKKFEKSPGKYLKKIKAAEDKPKK